MQDFCKAMKEASGVSLTKRQAIALIPLFKAYHAGQPGGNWWNVIYQLGLKVGLDDERASAIAHCRNSAQVKNSLRSEAVK